MLLSCHDSHTYNMQLKSVHFKLASHILLIHLVEDDMSAFVHVEFIQPTGQAICYISELNSMSPCTVLENTHTHTQV